MSTERTVTLSVDARTDGDLVKVVEVLSRSLAGLLLDGYEARIYSFTDSGEDED